MNEEQAKLIAEQVIELLHDSGWISEQKYGSMPVTLAEDIGQKIADEFNS